MSRLGFTRRTFIWRYCILLSFLLYLIFMSTFIPMLSSTPRIPLDPVDPVAATEPTVATRNYSQRAVSVPSIAAVIDGRRPLDAGVVVGDVILSTKPTKKPTELEVLHKNMTLHKANMSDLLKHVKAAVANRSDNAIFRNRKVMNAVDVSWLVNKSSSFTCCRLLEVRCRFSRQ